jgi:hypothetical protein
MAEALRPLLEALAANPGRKNYTGEIRSTEKILSSSSLAELEARHSGVFALILADEKHDADVFHYLKGDSAGNDTGSNIFALYEGAPKSRVVRDFKIDGLGTIRAESPIIVFARNLFPKHQIVLPGVVIIERLTGNEAVFVQITSRAPADVVDSLRKLWGLVNNTWKARTPDKLFVQALGESLALRGISYTRSQGIAVREHFTILLRALWDIRKDLLALIPVVGKAFGTKKPKE